MQQYIHSQADQAADTSQLGSAIATYQQILSPATKRSTYGRIIMYSILTMFSPCFILIGSLLNYSSQPLVIVISIIFFVAFGLITMTFTLIILRRTNIPWYIQLYSEGFISVKRHRVNAVRWDQVTAIRQQLILKPGFPTPISVVQYTLSLADGTHLTFGNTFLNIETAHLLDPRDRDLPKFNFIKRQESEWDDISARYGEAWKQEIELLYVMEREVVIRLFPKMIATYQEAQSVNFGSLQMSINGISNKETTLSWDEFDHITLCGADGEEDDPLFESVPYANSRSLVERLTNWQKEVSPQDEIIITAKDENGPLWSLSVSEVPNAFLLMELADYALHQQGIGHL